MSNPKQSHFIRIELPPDATPEEIQGLEQAVFALVLKHEEANDYDIAVSGGAWYPPEDNLSTKPLPVALRNLRTLVFEQQASNSPTDGAQLRDALQRVADLGLTSHDLQIHLECERTLNNVALRNMKVEENLLMALDMVTGNIGENHRVVFEAATR